MRSSGNRQNSSARNFVCVGVVEHKYAQKLQHEAITVIDLTEYRSASAPLRLVERGDQTHSKSGIRVLLKVKQKINIAY